MSHDGRFFHPECYVLLYWSIDINKRKYYYINKDRKKIKASNPICCVMNLWFPNMSGENGHIHWLQIIHWWRVERSNMILSKEIMSNRLLKKCTPEAISIAEFAIVLQSTLSSRTTPAIWWEVAQTQQNLWEFHIMMGSGSKQTASLYSHNCSLSASLSEAPCYRNRSSSGCSCATCGQVLVVFWKYKCN